jgi:hypothetical protein
MTLTCEASLPMHKSALLFVLSVSLVLIPACGDKLDPMVDDVTVPTGNGNTVTNPNTTGNPNTSGNPNATGNPNNSGNANTTPTPMGLCGTSDTKITYATHIANLVTTTCSSCHGPGGISPVMTNFTNTKASFDTGGSKEAVASGYMPKARTLTANQKCLFDTWTTTNFSP